MSLRSGAREGHVGSKGYLEYLDRTLGFSRGTLHNLCLATVKSKGKTKQGVKADISGRGRTRSTYDFSPLRSRA